MARGATNTQRMITMSGWSTRPTHPFSVSVSARCWRRAPSQGVPHKTALQQGERKTCRLLRFK
jgi:hypothetical protein